MHDILLVSVWMGGKLQHATLENKCVFSLLKKLSYLCFNAKMKGIIQKSENLDCQEPRLPRASRFSCAVEHFQAFHYCFLKKNVIFGDEIQHQKHLAAIYSELLQAFTPNPTRNYCNTSQNQIFFFTHPDTSWEALLPLISLNGAESSRPNMKPRSNLVLQTRWEVDL